MSVVTGSIPIEREVTTVSARPRACGAGRWMIPTTGTYRFVGAAAANGIQRGNIASTGYNSTEYVFGLNNTDNMRVNPDTDFCRVHALSIYDRYISDEEVVEYFNNTKQQYKL